MSVRVCTTSDRSTANFFAKTGKKTGELEVCERARAPESNAINFIVVSVVISRYILTCIEKSVLRCMH